MLLKTLEVTGHVFGEEHPKTLASMGWLAILYRSQGLYEEAELLYLKTLKIWKRVLGEEHLGTLNTMHNLATLYSSQGRYEERLEFTIRYTLPRSKLRF